ncbi:hypothetical protein D3C83_04150 [compost metagenome]
MEGAAVAGGRVIQPARLRSCQRDQRLHGIHRQRRVHQQDMGRHDGRRDRREIAQRVVRDPGKQRRIDGEGGVGAGEQRVAVGRRFRHDLRGDHAGTAAAVVDHHGLAELLGELRAEHARLRVVGAARGRRDQETDRPDRIVLRRLCEGSAQNDSRRKSGDRGACFNSTTTHHSRFTPFQV